MKINEVQLFPKHREHAKRQRQDSLQDQLRDLMKLAIQNGMYDAADFIQHNVLEKRDIIKQAVKRRSYSQEDGGGTWSSVKKDGEHRTVWIPGSDTQLSDNGPKNS